MEFRRGIAVRPLCAAGRFTQVTYDEWDTFPVGGFLTYQIPGWAPSEILASVQHRTFYHLTTEADTPASWAHFADNHTFRVFWAPLTDVPRLTEHQQCWLDYVMHDPRYRFSMAQAPGPGHPLGLGLPPPSRN